MVTIIACTMRSSFVDNVFANYDRQVWKDKEMIIVLNKDDMSLDEWNQRASQYPNNEVKVIQLPQKYHLGKCLNYAIANAKEGIIAKFDDDDYYGPNYLRESVAALKSGKGSIIGKHTSYLYFEEKKALMVFRPGGEHKYVRSVKGGTLVFKKSLWRRVKFPEFKKVGTDSGWTGRCRRRGYKIYSVSKKNYVCVRRKNTGSHTQKKSTKRYMSQCRLVRHTKNYSRFVT
ncbi:glycosyltransferase family 2 protein [Paenibacillus arenilitoris]|uniref:Glycosyltransferase family 2 protein n=1 Tax=Paenibacillus arenilitoris TaxID=2772299 RepID=A0A927H4S0_9BACL|nr:glycosyltransferase family A protein [Paenibacillus arenilitoris]MBD2868711.1 glycosyltransferase family 2 protein [Paenibacillus arenilitoris]